LVVRFSVSITTTRLWESNYSKYQQYLFDRIREYKDNCVTPIDYIKISQIFNKEGLKTPRGSMFRNNHVHSIHKKGLIREERWIRNIGKPLYNSKKEIIGRRGVSQDITQWMLAGQEIQEYQTSLQKLTTEITLIEEKQKKEIASNIHDHLSQSLVISKMKINELKKNPKLKEIDKDLKFIETHISEALENSRKITYELSPPVLYQLGIVDAVSWLLEDVQATHKVKCLLNCSAVDIKLSDVKSILLYRSIQEVINNAIKYAKASLITLDFDENNFGVDIFITDNGVGFDTSVLNNFQNHSGSGFGLFTVLERIRNIQGEFKIVSEKNIGTTVKIFIPLAK